MMELRGWICIITNKAMPNLVKIGHSTKDPRLLAAELSHTDSPHPYIVEFGTLVKKPHEIEQKINSALKNEHEGKEWFRCSFAHAVQTVRSVIGDSAVPANQRLDDPPAFEIKAGGKAQVYQERNREIEREEIQSRWRRKDQIRGEIADLLNLYSSDPTRITEAIKKKYSIEISHHRIRLNNIDEVVTLIDEKL